MRPIFANVPSIQSLIITLAFCLIPVLLWIPSLDAKSFSTLPLAFYTMGQACGIAGAALFALNFILTTRFAFLEDFFNGLNRVYLYHHNTGAFALILLLLHPLFLSIPSLSISFVSWFWYFLPPLSAWPQWMGEIALNIVIVLLFITFFVKLPYEFWKKTHQYLGLALIPATLHIAYTFGVISSLPALRVYMLGLYILASFAFLYKTAFGKFFIKKHPFLVSKVQQQGESNLEIFLAPEKEAMKYHPGQFIFVTVVNGDSIKKEPHPFSLTSSGDSQEISFAVKILGDFTESLKNIKPQTKVLIEGPYGRFLFHHAHHKQIWIAGGIGITPFLSMARSLPHKETPFEMTLYYVVSNEKEAVYLKELEEIAKGYPLLHVIPYYSEGMGRITAEVVHKDITDLHERDIFLCGPVPMMQSLRKQFKGIGIHNARIHSEEFQLL